MLVMIIIVNCVGKILFLWIVFIFWIKLNVYGFGFGVEYRIVIWKKKIEYIIILLNVFIFKVYDNNYIFGRMKFYLKNLMNFIEFLLCYYVDFYLDDIDII